jgi:putative hydrolase of the HAD superfamily
VYFDFDGVLTLNERGSVVTIGAIHKAHPDLDAEKVKDCYYRFHPPLLLGEVDHYTIWDAFCSCVGKNMAPDVLTQAFLATPMNIEMVDLAAKVAKSHRVGIITANAVERMTTFIEAHKLDLLFDPIVVSAEIGALKTDPLIFAKALGDRRPEACVFIDNQAKNLAVPAELGLKTYLFDPKQNDVPALRKQLGEWGVRV